MAADNIKNTKIIALTPKRKAAAIKEDNIIRIDNTDKISKTSDFAMMPYTVVMTMNQLKLHAIALSLIQKDDDPEENKLYPVNLESMFEYLDLKDKSTYKRNIIAAAMSLYEQNPQIALVREDKTILTNVFQAIHVPNNSSDSIIHVEYSHEFRKYMIRMKQEYDFEYPVAAILNFSCKYSPSLYNFLLGKIAKLKKENKEYELENKFTIETSLKEIMKVVRTETKNISTSKYNYNVINPAITDINKHTNMYIENGKPDYIKEGRAIVGYRFNITMRITPHDQVFRINNITNYKQIDEHLTLDYIINKIQEIGVNSQFAIYVKKDNNPKKAWKSYLYTLLKCATEEKAAYFNKVYKENWAQSETMESMFKSLLAENVPELQDVVCAWIGRFYHEKDNALFVESPDILIEDEIQLNTTNKKEQEETERLLREKDAEIARLKAQLEAKQEKQIPSYDPGKLYQDPIVITKKKEL